MVMDLATTIMCPFGAGCTVVLTTDQDMVLYGVCILATAANGDKELLQEGGCPQSERCRFNNGKEIMISDVEEDDEFNEDDDGWG